MPATPLVANTVSATTTISTSLVSGSTTASLDDSATNSATLVEETLLSALGSTTSTNNPSTTTYPIYSLTTTFTPPTACLEPTYFLFPDGLDVLTTETYVGYVGSVGGLTVANTETSIFRGVSSACFPPQFTNKVSYSPGVCPSGYATLHTDFADSIYTATCCPSGMLYNAPYTTCLSLALDDLSIVQHSATTTLQAANQSLYLLAPPITVAYHTSDLTLWTTTAASAASAPTSIVTPTSNSVHGGSSDQLTTGAQAGIGVGVALGLLAIVAATMLLLRRRRRNLASSHKEMTDLHLTKAELHDEGKTNAELGEEAAIYEVHSLSKPQEMDSMNVRAELESGWRGWEAAPGSIGKGNRQGRNRDEGF